MQFDTAVLKNIRDHILDNGHTLAVAESVTGGFLQAAFSSSERASEFFQGGVTTYNIHQKVSLLHIDRLKGEICNCVSQQTADEMALGTISLFNCNWAIAITGYATPVPESGFQLFAYYAICQDNTVLDGGKLSSGQQDPNQVQLDYVHQVLARFESLLHKKLHVA